MRKVTSLSYSLWLREIVHDLAHHDQSDEAGVRHSALFFVGLHREVVEERRGGSRGIEASRPVFDELAERGLRKTRVGGEVSGGKGKGKGKGAAWCKQGMERGREQRGTSRRVVSVVQTPRLD